MRSVAALVLALVVACHPAPAKKRLVVATTSEPDSLCPLVAEGGSAQEVTALLARDLVLEDPSWTAVPDLATAIPAMTSDNAVTWRIKDSARWQDGTPVTARDFIYAWHVQREQAGVSGKADAERIASMEPSADGRAFTVVWKVPNPFFAMPRVHRPLPAHLLEPKSERLVDSAYCRHPLSNGPFQLVEWVPGDHLLFARNEQYTPRAQLDEVLVKIVPTTTGILTMLASGDVDAALPSGGPSPVEAHRFVSERGAGFRAVDAPGQVWAHIDFNLDDPALKDVRVREALALAIPREKIVKAVSLGLYDVADGYVPKRHWAYAPVAPIAFDPARAKALLADAGVHELKLTISGASGQKEAEDLLVLVQSALKDVGVSVALDLRPFKVFFGEGARKHKTQLAFYSWTIDDSSMGGGLWRSDRIPSEGNAWTGQNFPGFVNDEATRLLTEADATLDLAARQQKIARVQQIVRAQMPAIPLYFRPVVALSSARVIGLAPTGTMTPLAWNASQWDLR